jgi:hypothetical protein
MKPELVFILQPSSFLLEGGRDNAAIHAVLTFFEAALSVFIVVMTFNVVDLVLLDWLLVERPLRHGTVAGGGGGRGWGVCVSKLRMRDEG